MIDRPYLSTDDVYRFKRIVSAHDDVAVCVAQIDPDGMGAALVLDRILKELGVRSHLFFGEPFGHPQSLALWRMLELEAVFRPFSDRPAGMPVALVDSSRLDDRRFGADVRLDPIVIIDHHDGDDITITDSTFRFVRPCGAASSMVLHLAEQIGVVLDAAAMTAAAVGIFTDSEHLISPSTTRLDDEMFHLAKAGCGQARFTSAMEYRMTDRHCRLVTQALARMAIEERILLADPGEFLHTGEGEALADAAQLLRLHEDAELVLVWGVVGRDLRVSARARGKLAERLTPILSRLFGPDSGSKHGAGGARRTIPPHRRTHGELTAAIAQEIRTSIRLLPTSLRP
jgi:nanoRNase/pAp phosphatase (c-di-AMP/oligoRNAs hydrolase)